MAATNYILTLYQRIFTLLENHAPTAASLKLGNEVREDQGRLNPRGSTAKAPADFPRVVLRHTGGTDTGFTEEPTFAAMESDIVTAGGTWIEKVTERFEIKAVYDDLSLNKSSIFELELKTAIRKGGPRLGIDYVTGWSTTTETVETDTDPDFPSRMRRVTKIILTVTCYFEGTELIV
jgi:hypothetical protein